MTRFWVQSWADHSQMLGPRSRAFLSCTYIYKRGLRPLVKVHCFWILETKVDLIFLNALIDLIFGVWSTGRAHLSQWSSISEHQLETNQNRNLPIQLVQDQPARTLINIKYWRFHNQIYYKFIYIVTSDLLKYIKLFYYHFIYFM